MLTVSHTRNCKINI